MSLNFEFFNLGLKLLLVGMLTVFFILLLVVLLSKLLIFITNKLYKEPPINQHSNRKSSKINRKHVAVISGVVQNITSGKGIIKEIRKL